MTLKHLPQKRRKTLREKILTSVSIAAAVLLFIALATPPIVRAAQPLIERLFGKIVEDIEHERARPENVKLQEMIELYENSSRWHPVKDAGITLGDVEVNVSTISTSPTDYYDHQNTNGELRIDLIYSKIPSFDPCWIDFTVSIDGIDIPMRIDETLKEFRRSQSKTLIAEQWEPWKYGGRFGNSQLVNGVPTTFLIFDINDWRWDAPKQLILKAMIDGQLIGIPFTFDPEKAHAEAIRIAKTSVALMDSNYEHDKDELEAMRANGISVGLSGAAQGSGYIISEISYANDKLFFSAAFNEIGEKNPKLAALSYWIDEITVDGMSTSMIGSDNDKFKDGQYTAVYQSTLGRDPKNLPEESLLAMKITLGDYTKEESVAFRYNWNKKEALLPKDEAEMKAWVDEANILQKMYERTYSKDVYYDLSALNLSQSKNGVTMAITGIAYSCGESRMKIYVQFDGDIDASSYYWHWTPEVKVNGNQAFDDGGSLNKDDVMTAFYIKPPIHISEFGAGTTVSFDMPLVLKSQYLEETNYPTPDSILNYEFAIDASMEPTKNPHR